MGPSIVPVPSPQQLLPHPCFYCCYLPPAAYTADVDAAPIARALESALPDVLNAAVGELNFKNVVSKLGDVMYLFPFR